MSRERLRNALRPIYDGPERACRRSLTACPGDHWPALPHGPLDGEVVDLVTIGANPQIPEYDPPPPTFDAWIDHGTSKSRDAAAYFLGLFGTRTAPDYGW